MVASLRNSIGIILALLCLPVSAQAEFPLAPMQAGNLYDVAWNGVPVGRMAVQTMEDDRRYRLDIGVKSKGVAWLFTKHYSASSVEGIKKDGRYIPQKYETVFKLRGKTRHIILTYDENGHLATEFNEPPEDRKKRPEVPMEKKKDALDPFTPFFAHREQILSALENKKPEFSLRMFDGRRLTEMHYRVHARKTVEWNKQYFAIIPYTLTRTPLAGYKKSEIEDYENGDDPKLLISLSDDGRLVPLAIDADSGIGSVRARFRGTCPDFASCLKKLE